MLFLLTLEPAVVVYEQDVFSPIRHEVEEPRLPASASDRMPPNRNHTALRRQDASSRYGMAPKTSLRTSILHPVDTLMLEEKSGGRSRVGDTPGRIHTTRTQQKETHTIHPPSQYNQTNVDRIIQTKSSVLNHPRVVSLDGHYFGATVSWSSKPNAPPSLIPPPPLETITFEPMVSTNEVLDDQNSTTEQSTLPFEQTFLEECEPIRKTKVHPTCNHLHELTMQEDSTVLLNTKGSWRSVWGVHNDSAVLKVLQLHRPFDAESYQNHALDVIVSDVLTASPYVIDAYGFCGQSILQEWAPGTGRDYVKSYGIGNRKRLQIMRDLARGLADLQALQRIPNSAFLQNSTRSNGEPPLVAWNPSPPPLTVFSHNDVNIANTIHVNEHVKWNDFNIGVFLRTRLLESNHTEDCGAPVKFKADLWRSPEEVRNTSYVQLGYTDMYGFGNILYQVMTRHQPWTHKEPEGQLTVAQVADRKRRGRLPTFPEKILNTTNKDIQIMLFATMSCYHPVPSKRLTAYEMAHALTYLCDRRQRKLPVPPEMLRDFFYRP